jgi:hypothetical protein
MAHTREEVTMYQRFFYVSLGILCLVLAYHLGDAAQGQTSGTASPTRTSSSPTTGTAILTKSTPSLKVPSTDDEALNIIRGTISYAGGPTLREGKGFKVSRVGNDCVVTFLHPFSEPPTVVVTPEQMAGEDPGTWLSVPVTQYIFDVNRSGFHVQFVRTDGNSIFDLVNFHFIAMGPR